MVEAVEVNVQDKDVNVRVQTPDSALLIGMHGKNIEAFQHLLGRMIEKIAPDFTHLHLEVNDYMKSKDERLYRFLDTKISFVTSTGKSARIPNLTSYERKKAHSYISDKNITHLKTRSDGEGAERALFLEYTGEIREQRPQTYASSLAPTAVAPRNNLSEDGVGI